MATSKYAVIDNDNKVIDIIEFDVMNFSTPSPCPELCKVKILDTIPQIGQVWDGEKFN